MRGARIPSAPPPEWRRPSALAIFLWPQRARTMVSSPSAWHVGACVWWRQRACARQWVGVGGQASQFIVQSVYPCEGCGCRSSRAALVVGEQGSRGPTGQMPPPPSPALTQPLGSPRTLHRAVDTVGGAGLMPHAHPGPLRSSWAFRLMHHTLSPGWRTTPPLSCTRANTRALPFTSVF